MNSSGKTFQEVEKELLKSKAAVGFIFNQTYGLQKLAVILQLREALHITSSEAENFIEDCREAYLKYLSSLQ